MRAVTGSLTLHSATVPELLHFQTEFLLTKGQRGGVAYVTEHRGSRTVCDDAPMWSRALERLPFAISDDVSAFRVSHRAPGEILMKNGLGRVETLTWISARLRVPESGDTSEAVVQFRFGSAIAPAPGFTKSDLTVAQLFIPFHWVYSKFVLAFGVSKACSIAGSG